MVARTLRLSIFTAAFVAALSVGAHAQPATTQRDSVPELRQPRAPRKPGPMGSPEAEMLRRAEIRHEEETHKEMVERADEAAQIGDEILASYKKNNSLTRDDLKKLERLEKLARKIRGGAGGSDADKDLHDPPGMIGGALSKLAELSGALKKSVLKTSRMVISAAVIERSNEIIELVRHIRSLKQP
ncbi:MAG TPA: hypothetical protein VGB98_23705 [Pyrinomonadaceae bacterium]|jgi:hypothetical protein